MGVSMTVHKLRLPTDREIEERHRKRANGFDDLENPICELRHMAKLARRETLIDGDDTRAFAVLKLCDMVEQLYDDYHEIGRSADPRPAVRKIGHTVLALPPGGLHPPRPIEFRQGRTLYTM